MKLLSEAAAATLIRLDAIENEARRLVSELDSLDIRLHRAFTAVCIDSYVAYLNAERHRMLKGEKQAETNASLASLPALGVYGLFSFFTGQEPDWKGAVSSVFRQEPYGDVRIAVSEDNIRLINVSKMARERDMTVAQVLAYLRRTGEQVLNWPEFESEAEKLRMAAIKGEAPHLETQIASLEDTQAVATSPGGGGIVVS